MDKKIRLISLPAWEKDAKGRGIFSFLHLNANQIDNQKGRGRDASFAHLKQIDRFEFEIFVNSEANPNIFKVKLVKKISENVQITYQNTCSNVHFCKGELILDTTSHGGGRGRGLCCPRGKKPFTSLWPCPVRFDETCIMMDSCSQKQSEYFFLQSLCSAVGALGLSRFRDRILLLSVLVSEKSNHNLAL